MVVMPEEYRAENDRLADLYFSRDDRSLTIGDIIDAYASDKFKAYCDHMDRYLDDQRAAGIMAG